MHSECLFTPNQHGFIKNWLVSGVCETEIDKEVELSKDAMQEMSVNKRTIPIKKAIFDDELKVPPTDIEIGKTSGLGLVWRYYQAGAKTFVDLSRFYHTMKKGEVHSATEIISDEDKTISIRTWYFPCIHIWMNGELVYSDKHYEHIPITYGDVALKLKKGKNLLFVRTQILGVINANNMFAVKFMDDFTGIRIKLPGGQEGYRDAVYMDEWLKSIRLEGNSKLTADKPPMCPVTIFADESREDWRVVALKNEVSETAKWDGAASWEFDKPYTHIELRTVAGGQSLVRRIEIGNNIKAVFNKQHEDMKLHRQKYLEKIAQTDISGKTTSSVMYPVLAKYVLESNDEKTDEAIYRAFDYIYQRKDCSDFLVGGILRLYITCADKLSDQLKTDIKNLLLKFRYWADEDGIDGMAMGTENHSLLFHSAQLITGNLFPDDVFILSKRTGKEQAEIGRQRVIKWLDRLEKTGFDEYNSGSYMPITQNALLNVIDFSGDAEISKRAAALLDVIYERIAMHTFGGISYAPQGRMYRGGIYPFEIGTQAMLYYAYPKAAASYSDWMSALAVSAYQIPDLEKLIDADIEEDYVTADVQLKLKKTADYLITSTAVPDLCGMARILPGQLSGQRNLMFASVGANCGVFVNHPGAEDDLTLLRPGYWYGNGIYPKMEQNGSVVTVEYDIPDSYPVWFTHCYFPGDEFDQTVISKHAVFGRKGASYIVIACDKELAPYDDVLQGREYRAYAKKVKWVVKCSSKKECKTFDEFVSQNQNLAF